MSIKQVERVVHAIGGERCAEREAAVRAYQELPLAARKAAPVGVPAPEAVVVQTDGGRLQIRDPRAGPRAPDAGRPEAAGSDDETPEAPGGDNDPGRTNHWREDKVGYLGVIPTPQPTADPCPLIPGHFVDAVRVSKLAAEIKGPSGATTGEPPPASSADVAAAPTDPRYEAPELARRSVVATRSPAGAFGAPLSQAAWARGFYAATRRAFVADGSSTNWGIWCRYFASFLPILDFIHALTSVYQAAMAGRSVADGWADYETWIGQVWAGQIDAVITAVKVRQTTLGPKAPDELDTRPRSKVAETVGDLENQKARRNDPAYRAAGLPITSCHVESTIKQINQRVKGTETFWTEAGAEAILQIRADLLSETEPLAAFWDRRQENQTGERIQKSLAA
ncbi:hypothetical protein [Fimbriiglobus ruber]|uniref:hypothetical protein n=1 Tax=Fimbriiglobus ruber TaxID=1908690 RepID=UPI001EE70DE7|nr:hypothetical protein [Fimbriiglobus ruber]